MPQHQTVIQIISNEAAKTLYGSPKEGVTAENRIIKVTHNNRKLTLYAKRYERKYELLYEIIGYLIAYHLNLPQPEAFVTLLSKDDQIRLFNTQNPTTNNFPVWTTTSIDGESAWFEYDRCSEVLKKDLNKWFNFYGAIAFDDLVGNIDRNLGNLIRKSSGKYYLIDHGMIFGGKTCKMKKLSADEQTKNILSESCVTWNNKRQQSKKNPILHIAEHASQHSEAFEKSKQELYFWWSRLAKGHERKLYYYLHERSKIETHIIKRKYNLLTI